MAPRRPGMRLSRGPSKGRLTPQFSGRARPGEARRERILKWRARNLAATPYHGMRDTLTCPLHELVIRRHRDPRHVVLRPTAVVDFATPACFFESVLLSSGAFRYRLWLSVVSRQRMLSHSSFLPHGPHQE